MTTSKKPIAKRCTDWGRLRHMSAASIRKGIAANPDANATDEKFWSSATIVIPTRKKV
jgi:hypothetical protein